MDFGALAQGIQRGLATYRGILKEREQEKQARGQQALGLFQTLLQAPKWQRGALRQAAGAAFPDIQIQGEFPEEPEEPTFNIPGIPFPVPQREARHYLPFLPGSPQQRQAGAAETRAEADVVRAGVEKDKLILQRDLGQGRLRLDRDKYKSDQDYRAAVMQFNQAKQKWLESYQKAQIAIAQGRADIARQAQAEMAKHHRAMEGIAAARVAIARQAVGRAANPLRDAWGAFFAGSANPQQMQYIQSQLRDPQAAADIGIIGKISGRAMNPAEQKIAAAALTRLAKKYGIQLTPADLNPASPGWGRVLKDIANKIYPFGEIFGPDTEEEESDDLEDLFD